MFLVYFNIMSFLGMVLGCFNFDCVKDGIWSSEILEKIFKEELIVNRILEVWVFYWSSFG